MVNLKTYIIKNKTIYLVLICSLILHSQGFLILNSATKLKDKNTPPVKIKIVEKTPKKEPKLQTESKPIKKKLPTKPKKIPKLKVKQVKRSKSKKAKNKPNKKPKIVQGLTKKSLSTDKTSNSGISVPVGNTLMTEDQGIRLKPEEIEKLEEDYSKDATITCVLKPSYTAEAEEAEIEGNFYFDIYLDQRGKPQEVEIQKKIGYGMDAIVKKMLMESCTFSPKLNPVGDPISTWATFPIRLKIDD